MIKNVLFAAAAASAAIGATLTATGPALAQTNTTSSATAQLGGAMRGVSLGEAMADAGRRAEFGLEERPVHTVLPSGASMVAPATNPAEPPPRLAMLDRFSIAEARLGDIMIGDGVDIVRPRRTLMLDGRATDDHDFGNTGFSEVDAFHTDPSPSQIGIRFSF